MLKLKNAFFFIANWILQVAKAVLRFLRSKTNTVTAQILVALSLVSAVVTFLTLTGYTPIIPTHEVVLTAFAINAALIFILIVMIIKELWGLHRAKKLGGLASNLHIKIVWLFAFIASMPVILISIAALLTLDRGFGQLLAGTIQNTINSSVNVANSYIDEQVQRIRIELSSMSNELDNGRFFFYDNVEEYQKILTANVILRGFTVGHIIDNTGMLLVKSNTPNADRFKSPESKVVAQIGNSDDIFVYHLTHGDAEYLEALLQLREQPNKYLHVVRQINPVISRFARETRQGAAEFQRFQERRFSIQLTFALMFLLMALIVIFSAIWVGLAFANRLIAPMRRLMGAANEVASGNLDVQVPIRPREGDLATLGITFNNMTERLKSQRNDLLASQDMLDERRRFTEAVLDGVNAGIIGLNAQGEITLFNPHARMLLGDEPHEVLGKKLGEHVPELKALLDEAVLSEKPLVQGNVLLLRNGQERTLHVQVTAEQGTPDNHGSVVTLDDLTDLVAAQRNTAWSDVARRIAHEIKNPLTPIQLSAERLKRRFGANIGEGADVFNQCTDTIIRQVGDIGRMVDEFSSFARMPKPVFEMNNLSSVVKEITFLSQVGFPNITFKSEAPDSLIAPFDRRLIGQTLTNLLKNAAEAIDGLNETAHNGEVLVRLSEHDDLIHIDIIDNGVGLPKENRNRLLEPYVTTRTKGTGLGLAIVGRVCEDHGGKLMLLDRDDGKRGANIRLILPKGLK